MSAENPVMNEIAKLDGSTVKRLQARIEQLEAAEGDGYGPAIAFYRELADLIGSQSAEINRLRNVVLSLEAVIEYSISPI